MNSSRGNVLFLILIAVALFAALSYAITSSSRGGGGDVSKEKAKLIASQIEQYTATLSSAVTRMTLTGGATLEQIGFSCINSARPHEFTDSSACTDPFASWSEATASTLKYQIFHPSGGGVTPLSSKNLGIGLKKFWDDGYPLWVTHYGQIYGVGSTTISLADSNGMDLVLLGVDIPKAVCQAINDKAAITGIPVFTATDTGIFAHPEKTAGDPFTRQNDMGDVGNSASPQFYGKFMGCMELSGYPGIYAFYSVVTAR